MEDETIESSNDLQPDLFEVQVVTARNDYKWISHGIEHGNYIPVRESEDDEFWKLRKKSGEPLWSFHVGPPGKEISVSYSALLKWARLSNHTEREMYFYAVAAADGYVLLKTKEETPRYLFPEDGKLALGIITGDDTSDFEWAISTGTKAVSGLHSKIIEIGAFTTADKWISRQVRTGDPIKVGVSKNLQLWKLDTIIGSNSWSIKARSKDNFAKPPFNLSTACVRNVNVRLLDELLLNLRISEINFQAKMTRGAVMLSVNSGGNVKYLTLGKGRILSLIDNERNAVSWEAKIVAPGKFTFPNGPKPECDEDSSTSVSSRL